MKPAWLRAVLRRNLIHRHRKYLATRHRLKILHLPVHRPGHLLQPRGVSRNFHHLRVYMRSRSAHKQGCSISAPAGAPRGCSTSALFRDYAPSPWMEVKRTASKVTFFTFEEGMSKTEYLFSVNLLHLRIGLQHLSDHIGVAHKTLGYWVIQHLKVENCDRSFSQQAVFVTWRKVSGLLISSLCILCCISMKLALPIPSKLF